MKDFPEWGDSKIERPFLRNKICSNLWLFGQTKRNILSSIHIMSEIGYTYHQGWGQLSYLRLDELLMVTCASNIVLGSHKHVSKFIVSSCITYKYTSSSTIYSPNDRCNNMLQKYSVF